MDYDPQFAKNASNINYYLAQSQNMRDFPQKDTLRNQYTVGRSQRLQIFIQTYKVLLQRRRNKIFHILKKIYNKNRQFVKDKLHPPTHRDLLYLVSTIPMLVTSYASIRSNKGAMTKGFFLTYGAYNRLSVAQRRFYSKAWSLPDGMNMEILTEASKLIRKAQYPWGTSKRTWIPKPGRKDSLRPITVPPFMDRVVQSSLMRVLQSIYEPWFEALNVSFGFRQRKGVHDAIYRLIRPANKGLFTAIEGDIKSAYDCLDKNKLMDIFAKRIKDRKLLKFIRQRIDYVYYDNSTSQFHKDEIGIPQGGIDSPYIWNIYMHEFDLYVKEYMTNLLEQYNSKRNSLGGSKPNKLYHSIRSNRYTTRLAIRWLLKLRSKQSYQHWLENEPDKALIKSVKHRINPYFNKQPMDYTVPNEIIYRLIKKAKDLKQMQIKQSYFNKKATKLRFEYSRYADDWIILGNFDQGLAEKIRLHLSTWLKENLGLTLLIEKTHITNISKEPAHFLGFEIWGDKSFLSKTKTHSGKFTLKRKATNLLAIPDKTRLINRLFMKGFCQRDGTPKGMRWLSNLDPFTLISRFNSVIQGMANFYVFSSNRPYHLNRWLFIVYQSCIRTLARKYNCSMAQIYKRYGTYLTYKGVKNYKDIRTIQYTTTIKLNDGSEYFKSWKLITPSMAIWDAMRKRKKSHFEMIAVPFQQAEDGVIPDYSPRASAVPSIKDIKFLEEINKFNIRTEAQLHCPCSLCGSMDKVEMHHIKHIRKSPISSNKGLPSWQMLMSLRNRLQIPVCKGCHLNKIHRGEYDGANLKSLHAPSYERYVGYDSRTINISNYLTKVDIGVFIKTLSEKGWTKKQ